MGFSAALLALTAVSAVSQIGKGYAQKAEANFNATLVEGKANLIDVQKDIENAQYNRLKGKVMGQSFAAMGASGVMPVGSPMAVLLDTETQINIDQAIGQLNLEQQKRYTQAEADSIRRQGKQAVYSGYSGAFSTMLKGAGEYAMYKGFNLDSGATKAGKG
jgi:hypothetical protein